MYSLLFKTYSKLDPFGIRLFSPSPTAFMWDYKHDKSGTGEGYYCDWRDLGLNWVSASSRYASNMGWELCKTESALYDKDTGKVIFDVATVDNYIQLFDFLILEKGLNCHLKELMISRNLAKNPGNCIAPGFYDEIHRTYGKPDVLTCFQEGKYSDIYRVDQFQCVHTRQQLDDALEYLLGERLAWAARKIVSQRKDLWGNFNAFRHNCTNYDAQLARGGDRSALYMKAANDYLEILTTVREYKDSLLSASRIPAYGCFHFESLARECNLDKAIADTIFSIRRLQESIMVVA